MKPKKSGAFGTALLYILVYTAVQSLVMTVLLIAKIFSEGGLTDLRDPAQILGFTGEITAPTLIVSGVLTVGGLLLFAKLRKRSPSEEYYLGKPRVLSLWQPVCLAAAASVVIEAVLELIPESALSSSFYNTVIDTLTGGNEILTFIAVVLAGPVCEEFIFRGAVFSSLRKAFDPITSSLITALLFGVIHMNLIQSAYAFVLGLLLSYAALCFDSILASIAMHITFNLAGSYLDLSAASSSQYTAILFLSAAVIVSVCVLMYRQNRDRLHRHFEA